MGLVKQGSKYTDEIRKEAAVLYAIKGNYASVGRDLNIPPETLNTWNKTEWWDSLVAEVRSQNQDKHISQYHRLTEKALNAAERGIDNLDGDKLTASDIKALTVAGCAATDKGRLLSNQPTSIKADSSSLKDLADQFRKLSADHRAIKDSVVSEQSPNKDEE